jgi:phospholipase C
VDGRIFPARVVFTSQEDHPMQLRALSLTLLFGTGIALAQFPPQIKNVIVIFQENRTPDNLFHFLAPVCPISPTATGLDACTPAVTTSCYDISSCGLSNRSGKTVPVTLTPAPMSGSVDPDHSHDGFVEMCDPDPQTFKCRNDGAWKTSSPAGSSYAYVDNVAVTNYDGTPGHLLDPYLKLAESYGWANFMFQTNQGPSYPAHQFMFGGTSALTAEDDAKSIFLAENFDSITVGFKAGCLAESGATSDLISPLFGSPGPGCRTYADGTIEECPIANTALVYPTNPVGTFCTDHKTMANVLDPHAISWRYYAPTPGLIWTAPDAIKSICQPAWVNPNNDESAGLECTGSEWLAHVDTKNLGTDILGDIQNCDLATVSWVIPDGEWSDHAGVNDQYGPSWVAAVVNALGSNPRCPAGTRDAGQKFWENTAIVVTWDDWGGWSDNQPAQNIAQLPCTTTDCQGDYQRGFRVPLIVVSAYTPAGYIDNGRHDFGSVLRMIEGINHLPEGALGFADKRASTDLHDFFRFQLPREYHVIPAQKDASFFLSNTKRPAVDPDDD